jgi:hypothetical protein
LIPGIIEDEPDRIASCDLRLAEIEQELQAAEGERRQYLAAQQERWLALLAIYNYGATSAEKTAIAEVLQKHSSP